MPISVTLDYECAVRVVWKKLKLSSDCGDSGSEKYKLGHGGTYGRVWRSLDSGGFVLVRLAGIWLQSP
jgi:hypothetical protein